MFGFIRLSFIFGCRCDVIAASDSSACGSLQFGATYCTAVNVTPLCRHERLIKSMQLNLGVFTLHSIRA